MWVHLTGRRILPRGGSIFSQGQFSGGLGAAIFRGKQFSVAGSFPDTSIAMYASEHTLRSITLNILFQM